MINLLPTDYRKELTYARRNTVMRKWVYGSILALLGLGLLIGGGFLYIKQSINQETKQVANSKRILQEKNVEQTQKRVNEISNNVKLALQVLSREILFSKLLKQIGSALPKETALKSLQIDKIQGGIQLNAGASNFNTGSQLQINLQDPTNGVFEKADINSINCGGGGAGSSTTTAKPDNAFPCDVSLRALFKKNNDFTFISPTPEKKP